MYKRYRKDLCPNIIKVFFFPTGNQSQTKFFIDIYIGLIQANFEYFPYILSSAVTFILYSNANKQKIRQQI